MPSAMRKGYLRTEGRNVAVRAVAKAGVFLGYLVMALQLSICYIKLLFNTMPWLRGEVARKGTFQEWAAHTTPKSAIARWAGMDTAWKYYTHKILLPSFSVVCTVSAQDILNYPAEEFLDYIWLTLGTHGFVAEHGVQDVVARISADLKHIHTGHAVSGISADGELATIHCETSEGPAVYEGFAHIIFSTQATRAASILSTYHKSLAPDAPQLKAVESQLRCLETFEYRSSIVINHTDPTLLPDDVNDQRELNLIIADTQLSVPTDSKKPAWDSAIAPTSYTMATHVLRRPKGYPVHLPQVYQTTDPIISPEKSSILSFARFERATVTVASKKALQGLSREEGRKWYQCATQGQSRLGELQGAGKMQGIPGPGIWVVGSYAYAGIPLLEGCVASSRDVVEQGIWRCEKLESRQKPW